MWRCDGQCVQSTRTGPGMLTRPASAGRARAAHGHVAAVARSSPKGSAQQPTYTELQCLCRAERHGILPAQTSGSGAWISTIQRRKASFVVSAGQFRSDQLRWQGNRHRAEAAVQITGGARGLSDSENRGLTDPVAGTAEDGAAPRCAKGLGRRSICGRSPKRRYEGRAVSQSFRRLTNSSADARSAKRKTRTDGR